MTRNVDKEMKVPAAWSRYEISSDGKRKEVLVTDVSVKGAEYDDALLKLMHKFKGCSGLDQNSAAAAWYQRPEFEEELVKEVKSPGSEYFCDCGGVWLAETGGDIHRRGTVDVEIQENGVLTPTDMFSSLDPKQRAVYMPGDGRGALIYGTGESNGRGKYLQILFNFSPDSEIPLRIGLVRDLP
jgi:hypothetical protein